RCYDLLVEFISRFSYYFVFFFQAEDGIRDWSVTGVQTCALPISADLETIVQKAIEKDAAHRYAHAAELAEDLRRFLEDRPIGARSEERRVGKEGRSRGSPGR